MNDYIINFRPYQIEDIDKDYMAYIEDKILNNESLAEEEVSIFLKTITYLVRYKINKNLDNYDYKCDLAQSILYHYFSKLNIPITLAMTQKVITSDIVGHSFTIIKLNVEGKMLNFLLDPTYIQFFNKEKCSKDKYFYYPSDNTYVLLAPDPGCFIDDLNDVTNLLNNGFDLLDENLAKVYGNSFYRTKRGKQQSNNFSIDGDMYINAFLKGKEKSSQSENDLKRSNMYVPLFLYDKEKNSVLK